MKIVNIIGGIGNQMFQYAFAYVLKKKHPNEKVLVDTSLFNGYNLHNGFEIERVFGSTINIAKWYELICVNWYVPYYKLSRFVRNILPKRKTVYRNRMYMSYDEKALGLKGNIYYDGYWQTSRYYEGYKSDIINLFKFKEFESERNIELAKLLKKQNSIAIHIRRGDYLNAPIYKDICEKDYYEKAIDYLFNIIDEPQFVIFSNDIVWCKENIEKLLRGKSVEYVDNNKGQDSYLDMQLMTYSRGMILANSSFSWWGAYLNQRKDKIVVVPHKWANIDRGEDIYEADWIKI